MIRHQLQIPPDDKEKTETHQANHLKPIYKNKTFETPKMLIKVHDKRSLHVIRRIKHQLYGDRNSRVSQSSKTASAERISLTPIDLQTLTLHYQTSDLAGRLF